MPAKPYPNCMFFRGDKMALDFVAMDFETANEKRASACAVALVFFEDGRVSKQYEWFIRPPHHLDYFNPFNTQIHGISSSDVADKPRFNEVWPQIHELLNNELVAAHNASFDISVLRHSLDVYGLSYPDIEFICTYNVARKTWDRQVSYSLKNIGNQLGYLFNHHHASDDARICGKILVEACIYHNCLSINELTQKIDMRVGILNEDIYCPCSVSNPYQRICKGKNDVLKISELPDESIKTNGAFNGKNVVFTGTLISMTRQYAAQMVVDNGGTVSRNVTKRANCLVMGVQDFSKFVDGKQSRKTKRAKELIEQGYPLEIIDEIQFLRMLSLEDEDGQHKTVFG
jgi:DNA polymerase-3 subunit epsilon